MPDDSQSDAYPAIRDYAIIGDTRSAALISRHGSIDWLCWPRFNSRSVFARILDANRGGYFEIRPSVPFETERRYVDDTNVLETTFITSGGRARVLDLMPALTEAQKDKTLLPFRELLRRIECIEGEVPVTVTYAPRPNYGQSVPQLIVRHGDTIACMDGPEIWSLRSDVAMNVVDRGVARAEVIVKCGERHDFALSYETHAPAVYARINSHTDAVIDETLDFWRQWSSQLEYDGPYHGQVLRSALTLKLMAYAPSGGIVAAPTTSLPELIGGIRNWDYRFCWLRDASFTVAALYDCGFEAEGSAFVDWLLYATRLTQPRLQILYDVFGESQLPEAQLDHLDGYRGSRPVRIGNAAHDQLQLDVYGEVLGAIEEYTERGATLLHDEQRLACGLAKVVMKRWREPDSGIWEKRGGRKQHVHAKIMLWAALDSALRLAEKGKIKGPVDQWRATKDEIKRVVLERGFNRKLNAFVAEFDGEELDASLLYVSRVGFLEGDDPRILGTIDAIREKLGYGDLILRYRSEKTDDGLPPGEGAFLPCSFWLVEGLAIAKRMDEATELFEKLLSRANDLGLLSEEASIPDGDLVGNFPQALTHIGLLNAALRLERPVARRGKGSDVSS
ncbi:MAG TPA: glycoside hydrolase family 15 protein [Thermoanaerobaculia bacterium]|jgi:GH15 family glucan-1,4-alpha-glucosidase